MASVKKSLDSDNESLMRMVKKKSDRNTGKKRKGEDNKADAR